MNVVLYESKACTLSVPVLNFAKQLLPSNTTIKLAKYKDEPSFLPHQKIFAMNSKETARQCFTEHIGATITKKCLFKGRPFGSTDRKIAIRK